ncbi:MAG: penicillin-binding protein [Firmicutes bacterium]|nr:penicillin-binding protein [Bacillota bacterium]
MKKLEVRATICLLLVLAMLAGLAFFVFRLETQGDRWAVQSYNSHIFSNGTLTCGKLLDRDGKTLLQYTPDGPAYLGSEYERRAVATVTGDVNYGNPTGANLVFRSGLAGYNRVTGTEGFFGRKGGTVTLSIDSDYNETAYSAMGNRNGLVCVYNYKTGEIVTLVSTPTVDPADKGAMSTAADGAYINKVTSATFTPGSIFKVVTACAAIENVDGLADRTFTCTGSVTIDGNNVTCPKNHGEVDFAGALASSCNCYFGQLAVDIGAEKMQEYVDKMRLTSSYDINGIKTLPGSFNFATDDVALAWSGIGQGEDLVNPLSMMVFMGAIANDGKAQIPTLLKGVDNGYVDLMDERTAQRLKALLVNNVEQNYGTDNFPGLNIGAKSGSAETVEGKATNAWFSGFAGDYAFIVMLENAGAGATVAGPVANTVLQQIVYGR